MRYAMLNWMTQHLSLSPEFDDPNELNSSVGSDTYLFDESDTRRFLELVKSHPADTARFTLHTPSMMLGYVGDYDSGTAMYEDLKAKGEDHQSHRLLDTPTVRGWSL